MKYIFILTISILMLSCKKEGVNHECYDKSLVHNNPCFTDCPGFLGCDGKTYCNSCNAASKGIGPK